MVQATEKTIFEIGREELPPSIGGKALGLARIVRAGLPVSPAWVVLPGSTEAALRSLAARLAAERIERVAVRSSAADEDGARFSFAGMHETELSVPLDRLPGAVARVAASPLHDRAQSYRRQQGLPLATNPCAVIVQQMVEADWAGVAFGDADAVLVEAVEGLAETAVNGDATPERIEVVRSLGELRVARRWPRRQPFAIRSSPGGTERVPLEGARPELPTAPALEVAAGTVALQRSAGSPIDVEWAARGGQVTFLQARPQTVRLEAALPPGETWTRTNVSDTVPEITSACARAYMVPVLDRLMHRMYARFGVPISDRLPLAATVAGRVLFNERSVYGFGDLLGLPRAWMKLVMGGGGAPSNAYAAPSLWMVLRRAGLLLRFARYTRAAEGSGRAFIARLREEIVREAGAPPLGELALEPYRAELQRANALIDDGMDVTVQVACALQQTLSSGAMLLRKHPAPAAALSRLLDPETTSVTTRQMEEQLELALAMRGWAGGRQFLAEVTPAHADRVHWQRTLPPELWERTARWLAAYGHRGLYESDLAQPRYGEDLRLLATALRPFVTSDDEPEPLEERRARRRSDWERAWQEVGALVGPLGRRSLRATVRRLAALMQLREELRSTVTGRGVVSRQQVLDLGRRLVAAGRLEAVEDVFHLDQRELERALFEPGFDARAAVARERARVAAWRRVHVPNHFRSEEIPAFGRVDASQPGAGGTLPGTAVSPGVVEARACVLRSPEEEAKMTTGGVLVARTTDPGWTHLFARASAVVVEIGGVLSHAATVAREFGLPCVSNVDDVVARVRDGDLLRVDGTHGVVEIVERAGAAAE